MKYMLLQVLVLTVIVGGAVALGRGAVLNRWGPDGLASLHAAAVIALGAALLAAIPLGLAAAYWRQHAPLTAFAGTAIRLLVTGALAVGYQVMGRPHLDSFLVCLLAIYLLLLLAETVLIVYIVRRVYPRSAPKPE